MSNENDVDPEASVRILFLQPVKSHVRFQRRLEKLEEQGADVEILSFDRDYYVGREMDRDYVSLGRLEHGHYLKRIPLLLRAVYTIRKHLQSCDVAYAFGLDMALVACLARTGIRRRPKLVYEVGDIVEVFLRTGFIARAWRILEGLVLSRVDLLVTTSEAFIREYFQPVHGRRVPKTLVVENKPKLVRSTDSADVRSANTVAEGPLRIGWFGLLRCARSMEILSELVRRGEGRFELVLRGIGMAGLNLEEWAESSEYISFGGPYVVPADLPKMYEDVDLVWGCFPLLGPDQSEMRSGTMARTNRFYEACFFRRPLINRSDSEDGRVIEMNDIGLCVELRNQEETVERLLSISGEQIKTWRAAIDQLPAGVYSYTDEHERLLRELQ